MRFDDHRSACLFIVVVCLAMVPVTAGQTARLGDSAADLARAQQLYDDGSYRRATVILSRMVESKPSDSNVGPEIVGALRVLAQVYHRSADYGAAVRSGERYLRLTPQADAEVLLILADSHLALGHVEEARRQLERAAPILTNRAAGNARQARLAIEVQRISIAIQKATPKGSSRSANESKGVSGAVQRLAISANNFEEHERFEVVAQEATNYLDANQPDQSIGLLIREISSRSYNPDELADLKLQLVECYRRQVSAGRDSDKRTTTQSAMEAENRVLDSLTADLTRQRTRAAGTDDFLKLLPREGTLHERKAELAQVSAQLRRKENLVDVKAAGAIQIRATEQMQQARKSYEDLSSLVEKLDRANPVSRGGESQSDLAARASQQEQSRRSLPNSCATYRTG
jgi:hypothetical protein